MVQEMNQKGLNGDGQPRAGSSGKSIIDKAKKVKTSWAKST